MKTLPLFTLSLFALLSVPNRAFAYNSKDHANAAMMISAACMWWQAGKIPRSQIMPTAQEQYRKRYGNPSKVNWNTAIAIAEQVDKKKGLGCFK